VVGREREEGEVDDDEYNDCIKPTTNIPTSQHPNQHPAQIKLYSASTALKEKRVCVTTVFLKDIFGIEPKLAGPKPAVITITLYVHEL